MTAEDLILNLKAAGFEAEKIRDYLTCWKAGKIKEQMKLLSAKRAILLKHVHQEEKQIGCLDYLVYQIEKGCAMAQPVAGRSNQGMEELHNDQDSESDF